MDPYSVDPNDVYDVTVRGIEMRQYVGNSRLRSWAENMDRIEPELLDWIDRFEPGAVFYDLGASIGNFSLFAAIKARAQVVAFEPEAQNFATLELNHYLNRDRLAHPLISLNLALSDRAGIGRIYTRVYGAGEHVKILDRAATRDTGEAFDPAHVQTVIKLPLDKVLDDFDLPMPKHVKIDVDGAELSVLEGAAGTLSNHAVRSVFIELYQPEGGTLPEIAALERFGFIASRRVPVARLKGGVYPGLFNYVFVRPREGGGK